MAVFPVAPGSPDYSSTSNSKYIPAIYSALLIKKYYPTTVFGEITNTDYEGDIKSQGDTIYIRTRPTIDTFDYKKGMVLPVQNPESPYVTMKVDQGEGFSFAIDKVDEFQSDLKLMNLWAEDATQQMKQRIDKKLLSFLADLNDSGLTVAGNPLSNTTGLIINGNTTSVGTTIALGTGSSPTDISTAASTAGPGATAVDESDWLVNRILAYGQYLDENNAPDDGRFIIIPALIAQKLKAATGKLGQVYVTGDSTAPIRNGKIGNIDRFQIYSSNNLTAGSAGAASKHLIFGQKYALTFATQITESRIIDNPFSFGKMMQGLQVYGMQIIKPNFLGIDCLTP